MIYTNHPLTLEMFDCLTTVSESMRKHLYGRCIACGVTTVESLIGIKYDDLDTITGIGLDTKYRVLWPFIENMKEKLRNGEIKSEKPNCWSDEDRRDIVHNINDLMELEEFKLILKVFSQDVPRCDSIKFIYEEYGNGKGSFFDRSACELCITHTPKDSKQSRKSPRYLFIESTRIGTEQCLVLSDHMRKTSFDKQKYRLGGPIMILVRSKKYLCRYDLKNTKHFDLKRTDVETLINLLESYLYYETTPENIRDILGEDLDDYLDSKTGTKEEV